MRGPLLINRFILTYLTDKAQLNSSTTTEAVMQVARVIDPFAPHQPPLDRKCCSHLTNCPSAGNVTRTSPPAPRQEMLLSPHRPLLGRKCWPGNLAVFKDSTERVSLEGWGDQSSMAPDGGTVFRNVLAWDPHLTAGEAHKHVHLVARAEETRPVRLRS